MLAGVAAGLADYFDVDPTIVRIGFVVLAFVGGLAVPLYLAGWLLIPEEEHRPLGRRGAASPASGPAAPSERPAGPPTHCRTTHRLNRPTQTHRPTD